MYIDIKKIIYPKLAIEILNNKINLEKIAQIWNVKTDTAKKKLYGQIGISLKQCQRLVDNLDNKKNIGYYFEFKKEG